MKIKLSLAASLLFLLSLAVLLTIYLAWLLYPLEVQWLDLERAAGVSGRTVQSNFNILLDYLTNPFNWRLEMPDFPSSKAGLYHFESVKKLFHLVQGSFVFSLPGFLHFFRQVVSKGYGLLFSKGFVYMALAPVFIVLLAGLMGFSQFFVLFHQLLFPGDSTWLFNPETDPVIWILPETYFLHCFVLFFLIYETLMISMYVFAKRKKPKNFLKI